MANRNITFQLLEKIFSLRFGAGTGSMKKFVIDLSEYEGAKVEDVYNYFLSDALIIIHWDNNKFYIAKF